MLSLSGRVLVLHGSQPDLGKNRSQYRQSVRNASPYPAVTNLFVLGVFFVVHSGSDVFPFMIRVLKGRSPHGLHTPRHKETR